MISLQKWQKIKAGPCNPKKLLNTQILYSQICNELESLFLHKNLHKPLDTLTVYAQWGSEYLTCLVFKWLKVVL